MPPGRGVRRAPQTLEEVVAHEDPDDDDYDEKAPGPVRSRIHKRHPREKGVKRKVRRYQGSDVDSDDDDIDSEDDEISYESSREDTPAVEMNEGGRPIRNAVKKTVTYEESDPEEDDNPMTDSEPEEADVKPKQLRRTDRSLIVKLRTSATPVTTPAPALRTLRQRSASFTGNQRPTSSSSNPHGKRRSSRISHDEEEAVVALTNSGNHVEVIRPGSRDRDVPQRPTRGGKGIKYPSKSTIDEERESGSALEIAASQQTDQDIEGDRVEPLPKLVSDMDAPDADEDMHEYLPTAVANNENEDEVEVHRADDDDADEDADEDDIVPTAGRRTRASIKRKAESPIEVTHDNGRRLTRGNLRAGEASRPSRSKRRKTQEESSDFAPEEDVDKEAEMSASSESQASPRASQRHGGSESSNGRRSNRLRRKVASRESPASMDELAAEAEELKRDSRKKQREMRNEILFEPRGTRNAGKKLNYDLMRGAPMIDEEEDAPPTNSQRPRKAGGGSGWRSLFSTYGPFGGTGAATLFGGPSNVGPAADDSDSSDEEVMKRPKPVGGAVGVTPTSAFPSGFNLFPPGQTLNSEAAQAATGTPANLGKVKDKQLLADADPLGVDQHVTFEGVGGLQGHIDQLKEMVQLPLLYPEIFMRFHITPPRGVLFHGPPGTGKTLLARALASSVSSHGKKVTFYMRKGADALSKWVGEAEKQLRLLFEEARRTQPSIIFFDEIDGLAPVRSSKQEQIHASIVSTLLALMDGMDGRGQVVVIGATNRPDNIDPALRRPGRFDREFYFPLPNMEGRRAILDIHTKGWNPPLNSAIKDELAVLTKGYGGADLRALCTEAALNAVQRRYPQIYASNEKLIIDPKTIEVGPKDFMISVKKMVPSSERSASSGASTLPPAVEPLLRKPLDALKLIVDEILPQKKLLTALQEAQYEDAVDENGFHREKMQQTFETSRVFRPRLLIQGKAGMGQGYLAAAMLSHFEGLHVQSLDLATLLGDTSSSPEAQVIRLFAEVKMHKPSVIYIPNIQLWYQTVPGPVISTFRGLLRSLKPTDPILLLAIMEADDNDAGDTHGVIDDLFGYSKKNLFILDRPHADERKGFFESLIGYVKTSPANFPDRENRSKRVLEVLEIAPPEPEKPPPPLSKEELKAQKKRDHQTLNILKLKLQPIMDQIRTRHRKFRNPVIDESQIRYLFDEADPATVSSDLPTIIQAQASFRPFELGKDSHSIEGIVDQASDKFYYNLETVTIEKRLSNGYYKRPKDFLADIKRLAKDAKAIGDEERLLRANELVANVEVDIGMIDLTDTAFVQECERVYLREQLRKDEAIEKARKAAEANREMPPPRVNYNVPPVGASEPSTTTTSMGGPIMLGEAIPNGRSIFNRGEPTTPSRPRSNSTTMTNGVHHEDRFGGRNGSSSLNGGNEADVEGDTPMGGTESHPNSQERSHETSSFGQSAQPLPPYSHTAPSQLMRKESGMSAPLSQTDVITPMAAGSQAVDYQNDASTTQTTSGKKNSGPSTGERVHSTQEIGPNLTLYEERRSVGESQIPSTQDFASSQASVLRQASPPEMNPLIGAAAGQVPGPPPPARHSSGSLKAILNPNDEAPAQPQPQIDPARIDRLWQEVVDYTTGLSVEQLEQVNSNLMDVVWKTRSEWNRNSVADKVANAFNEVMEDMNKTQHLESGSWGRATQG